ARAVFLAQAWEERAARDERFFYRGYVAAKPGGLVEDNFQIIGRACVARGPQMSDGIHLQFGVAGAGWKHGHSKRASAVIQQKPAWRHVIREAIVEDLALPETRCVKGAGKAPCAGDRRLRLENRTGRHENACRPRTGEPAEWRGSSLKLGQLRFPQHRKMCERLPGTNRSGIDACEAGLPASHPALQFREKRRKLREK